MPPTEHQDALQPCIAELLRTCHYPSHINLRVEKIIEENCNAVQGADDSPHAEEHNVLAGIRLLVSDAEWMINATLNKHLHRLVRKKAISEGSIISLTKYRLQRAPRATGKGEVLFLAINDLQIIAQEDLAVRTSLQAGQPEGSFMSASMHFAEKSPSQNSVSSYGSAKISFFNELESAAVNDDGKRSISMSPRSTPKKRKLGTQSPGPKSPDQFGQTQTTPSKGSTLREVTMLEPEAEDSDDDFETAVTDTALLERNRQRLNKMNVNVASAAITSSLVKTSAKVLNAEAPRQSNHHTTHLKIDPHHHAQYPTSKLVTNSPSKKSPSSPVAPKSTPTPAPPLHTLASLVKPSTPLPQKNYRCSVFGVISWVSPSLIKKPGFPMKRHVKVHDQTIADRYSGISISIFLDAEHFVPKTGTVALFRGMRAQWWESEIILNAYDNECRDKEWFVTDKALLGKEGLDWQALEAWWEQRQAKQRNRRG